MDIHGHFRTFRASRAAFDAAPACRARARPHGNDRRWERAPDRAIRNVCGTKKPTPKNLGFRWLRLALAGFRRSFCRLSVGFPPPRSWLSLAFRRRKSQRKPRCRRRPKRETWRAGPGFGTLNKNGTKSELCQAWRRARLTIRVHDARPPDGRPFGSAFPAFSVDGRGDDCQARFFVRDSRPDGRAQIRPHAVSTSFILIVLRKDPTPGDG